jgi:hypothetical protein
VNRNLIVVCAGFSIVLPALVCLSYSRATDTFNEQAVKERLDLVPPEFPGWMAYQPNEEDVSAFKDEQYPGFMRRYVNPVLGHQVLLLISGGPSGPLVYHHHPQQCYEAIGFTPHRGTIKRRVATDEFAVADFTKPSVSPESLRIYWAWSGDGVWAAPDEPRFRFGTFPLLYRIYVVQPIGSHEDPHDGDSCEEFLKIAIPGINKALFVNN